MDEELLIEGEIPEGRLSFSKIKTFTWCPHMFYLRYVEKVKGLVRIPMILGGKWHLGQEFGIKRMIEKSTPKTKEVVEFAVEELKIEFKKKNKIDFTEFDPNKSMAKDDLKRMVEYGFAEIVRTFKPTGSEVHFDFKLDEDTLVKGVADVEEETEEGQGLTEMKTTTRKPSDLIVFDWQTSIYAYAKKTYKWMKKLFVIRHINNNRDITILQLKKAVDSPEWLADVIKSMKQIKEMIKTCSLFGYPKTSDLQTCSWCAYRYGCKPELFSYENKVSKIISKKILFTNNQNELKKIGGKIDGYVESKGNIITGIDFGSPDGDFTGQRDSGDTEGNPNRRKAGEGLPSNF
jgi:CRISPR/Cas system-associated exonuclease Cas4 (RecB family)